METPDRSQTVRRFRLEEKMKKVMDKFMDEAVEKIKGRLGSASSILRYQNRYGD